MKNKKRRRIGWAIFGAALATLAVFTVLLLPRQASCSDADGDTVNILFTHDMHDHYEAHQVTGAEEYLGGYARLASAIEANRGDNTIYVDAGDFSMGSVIQTVFEADAPSLRILGELGCDATTLGNHEFDYGSDALAFALESAADSGCALPALLISNLDDVVSDTGTELHSALLDYGAKQYTVIERGGVKIGIFGIVGRSAMSSAYRSTTEFSDEISAARGEVAALRSEGAELIVCLSYSGTSSFTFASQDENLARLVGGIDVIVSGHSHVLREKPLCVCGTLIVSCGQNAEHLGSLTLVRDGDSWALKDYSMIDVDSSFPEDAAVTSLIEGILFDVDSLYMSRFGYSCDEVAAHSSFDFSTGLPYANDHYNEPLGLFITDAQRYAIEKAEGDAYQYIDVSIVMDAAIRGGIDAGDVTVGELYAVRGIGCGIDGYSGDPLVTLYLSGRELRYLCEADATIADFAPAAQLYMSGVTYTYSKKSLPLARVENVYTVRDGVSEPLDEDRLYRVSTCLYNMDTFGIPGGYTLGAISIVPKNADGTPIDDFNSAIVYTDVGGARVELKEWLALVQYASSFPKTDGTPEIDPEYEGLFTERTELTRANWRGYAAVAIGAVALAALITAIVLLSKRARRKKQKHNEDGGK